MIMYEFVVAVYIDEKDTESLRSLFSGDQYDFEDDFDSYHNDPDWQEHYRKKTGFSGKIKCCYITERLADRFDSDIFQVLKTADFDMLVIHEAS